MMMTSVTMKICLYIELISFGFSTALQSRT